MNQKTSTKLQPNQENKKKIPWWQRPVWGEDSLLEDLISLFRKTPVNEGVIFLHNREMSDAAILAKTARAIDNDKFTKDEFLLFIKIKYYVGRDLEDYEGLSDSIKLLQVAIEAKNSYILLDQTESRYCSSKQQELYRFVEQQLQDQVEGEQLQTRIKEKLADILPHIKTDEGRLALESYVQQLEKLSRQELGLKLLALFKTYNLTDYSTLRVVSDIVNQLREQETTDIKSLVSLVMTNYDTFERLGQIIGITEKRSTPETYARMIQYITLSFRHEISFSKFEELISVLKRWSRHYQAIMGIRNEHPQKQYSLPREFFSPIPGVDIYEKYRKSLVDQKTGFSYYKFEDEE